MQLINHLQTSSNQHSSLKYGDSRAREINQALTHATNKQNATDAS